MPQEVRKAWVGFAHKKRQGRICPRRAATLRDGGAHHHSNKNGEGIAPRKQEASGEGIAPLTLTLTLTLTQAHTHLVKRRNPATSYTSSNWDFPNGRNKDRTKR